MNNKRWKFENKPGACTKNPLYHLIPESIRHATLRTIRQDCINALGHDLDSCPKRKVCLGKKCLGRPLPTFSAAASPYIEKLKLTQIVKNGELFIQGCELCPINEKCKEPCEQVLDSVNRNESKEAILYYKATVDNKIEELNEEFEGTISFNFEIPWDVLNERKKKIVKMYLYKERDFRFIADELGLNNEAFVKFEFYSALNKLSKYGTMRNFLKKKADLTKKQKLVLDKVFNENLTIREAANKLNMSEQSAQAIINRVVIKNNIKWQTFVRRSGNKLIYNIPSLLK